eukprot:CAMPEP_0179010018 /NCGR_PEP_ID=MMETSP0795-20121207/16578_1 /TAXON_ID=88552 /ORGANISM="Amoebophrya sp., Strain Ameob2" /LENGTH=150 /DNA_ID=CAMNT_0020705247 /DNA_START=127 /DNA_END=579 /DNA_ORIENTATION=+
MKLVSFLLDTGSIIPAVTELKQPGILIINAVYLILIGASLAVGTPLRAPLAQLKIEGPRVSGGDAKVVGLTYMLLGILTHGLAMTASGFFAGGPVTAKELCQVFAAAYGAEIGVRVSIDRVPLDKPKAWGGMTSTVVLCAAMLYAGFYLP